jgi:hypothetical protein
MAVATMACQRSGTPRSVHDWTVFIGTPSNFDTRLMPNRLMARARLVLAVAVMR